MSARQTIWSVSRTGSWPSSSSPSDWHPTCRSRNNCPGDPGSVPDPFVHLHVASGYSLQYGASHPHVLVERALEQEMDALRSEEHTSELQSLMRISYAVF